TALVEDVVTWRREGYRPQAHTRTFGVQVKVSDVVDALRPLTARRSACVLSSITAPAALVSRVTELEAELDRVAADSRPTGEPIRSGIAVGGPTPPQTQTTGARAKAGRLVIRPGTGLRGAPVSHAGHHDVLGVPEALGWARRGDRRIDRLVLAGLARARLTEPGDLVVTTTPEFGVLVDRAGLAVVAVPPRGLPVPAAPRQSFPPPPPPGPLAERRPTRRPP